MAEAGGDMKYCSNCLRDIAAENFLMHEVHCRRNIILCTDCKEPVARSEMDDHYEEYHASTQCTKCKKHMEKSQLEDHQGECPRRVVSCEYCELELPYDEMTSSHKEYCGTRTEMCALCSQYIMHKDKEKHEQSKCSYPPPKHNNNNTNPSTSSNHRPRVANTADPRGGGGVNVFAMDEISRLMQMSSVNAPHPATMVTRNNIRAPKRINEQRGGGGGERRAGPGRHNRDINDLSTYNDALLAQHLAQDLGDEEEERDDDDMSNWVAMDIDPRGYAEIDHHRYANIDHHRYADRDHNRYDPLQESHAAADDECLPCEFCHESIPIDMLIQHQSGCQLAVQEALQRESGRSSPPRGGRRSGPRGASHPPVLNNSRQHPRPRELSSPVSVLDNLTADHQEWVPGPSVSSMASDGLLLPCEFCEHLIAEDMLVQHQAMCDANRTQTPRGPRTRAQHAQDQEDERFFTIPNNIQPKPRSKPYQAQHTTTQPPAPDIRSKQSTRGGQQRSRGGQQGLRGGLQGQPVGLEISPAGRRWSETAGTKDAIHGTRGTKKRNPRGGKDESYVQFTTHNDWTASGDADESSNGSRAASVAAVRATLDTLLDEPLISPTELEHLEKKHKMQENANARIKAANATGPGGGTKRRVSKDDRKIEIADWTANDNDDGFHYQPSTTQIRPVGRQKKFGAAAASGRGGGGGRQEDHLSGGPSGRNEDLRANRQTKKTTSTTTTTTTTKRGRGGGRGRRPPQGDV